MIRQSWTKFFDRVTDAFADKLMVRMEQENALPLPTKWYDVVVDDPEMFAKHEYRDISAVSARAAGIEGYRRAMRDEGFRCVASHGAGDEVTVEVVSVEASMWAVVHLASAKVRA
jgi:hypothetical protein